MTWRRCLKRREAHTARRRHDNRDNQDDHGPRPAGSCGFCINKGVDRSCFRSPRHRSPQVRSPSQLGCPGNGTTVDSESLNLFTQNPLFLPAHVASSHQGVEALARYAICETFSLSLSLSPSLFILFPLSANSQAAVSSKMYDEPPLYTAEAGGHPVHRHQAISPPRSGRVARGRGSYSPAWVQCLAFIYT